MRRTAADQQIFDATYASFLFPPFSRANLPTVLPFLAQTYKMRNSKVTNDGSKWILNMIALLNGQLEDVNLSSRSESSTMGDITVKSLLRFPQDPEKMVVAFVRDLMSVVQIR